VTDRLSVVHQAAADYLGGRRSKVAVVRIEVLGLQPNNIFRSICPPCCVISSRCVETTPLFVRVTVYCVHYVKISRCVCTRTSGSLVCFFLSAVICFALVLSLRQFIYPIVFCLEFRPKKLRHAAVRGLQRERPQVPVLLRLLPCDGKRLIQFV
jgi:hypothetical protein